MEETLSPQQSQPADRISALSDALLHRILSSLDFPLVIRTGFLSRRWRYVWTSLPYLNFDFEQYYKCNSLKRLHKLGFLAFVNRVLFRHIQRSASLHSFSLSLSFDIPCDGCSLTYMITWFQVVEMYNNAVEVELNAPNLIMEVHPSLYTWTCLTKLRLAKPQVWLNYVFDGSAVNLPRLKTLHLEGISILLNENIAEGSFLGRCVVLETLVLSDCCLDRHGLLHICLPQLKTLEIMNLRHCIGCKITASKLASFKCQTDQSICGYIFVEEATSLVEATVMFYDEPLLQFYDESHLQRHPECLDKVSISKNLIGNLNGINSVKSLVLSTRFFEVIEIPECSKSELLQFWNLRFLRLSDINLSRSHTSVVSYLLEKCPNVETLSIEMAPTLQNQVKLKTGDKSWRQTFQCSKLYHLKFLEIRNVAGCKTVLELLEYFMKNAEKLEKVKIFTFKEEEPQYPRRSKKSIARKRNRMEKFSCMLKKFRSAYSSIEVSISSGMHQEPMPKPIRRVRAKASYPLRRN